MVKPILTLERVEKRFGATQAVHPTDLEMEKGEFIALMGPSGCGKTTTLRMIAGLEFPSAGRILRWENNDITTLPPWKRDAPMVWQNYALFPFKSVVQNVEFGLNQRRRHDRPTRRRKAMEWLDRLGIADFADRRIDQLSGGQRQRVAIARALALEPELLLLDEPLSALDAHLRVRMQSEIKRLHRELGITFVYVTHNQSEAFAMADRVAIMNGGRMEQLGPAREVYRAPATRFVAEFVGANNIFEGTVAEANGREVVFDTALGRFPAPVEGGLAAGSRGAFIVAADRIEVSDAPTGAPNEVAARVMAEEFVGSFVTLILETEAGVEITAQRQQSELDRLALQPGSAVHARWDPAHAYVLPT
jgi:spermidine/putrescine transport system ATP-binding protein